MPNKYWDIMTPKQRSKEMARRRAKSTKPAGGFSYNPEAARIAANIRWSKTKDGKEQTKDSSRPS